MWQSVSLNYASFIRKWVMEAHLSGHTQNLNCEQKKIPFCGILCFLMIVLFPGVHSKLVEVPRNAVAWEHETLDVIDMACKSDYQRRLKWNAHKNNHSGSEVLYNGYFLRSDTESYCTVTTDESRKCYLHLRNTAEAAQTYICVEPGSLSEASADLIWIKSNPICNNSSYEDLVDLTCSIEFRGNWAPTMEWKEHSSIAEKVLSVDTVTIPNQRVISTLIMKVQKDSRYYTCTTKFDSSGKPNTTTATNVPDYNRTWTSSLLPKTLDETVDRSPPNAMEDDISRFIQLIVSLVAIIVAVLMITIVCICIRKRGGAMACSSSYPPTLLHGDETCFQEPAHTKLNQWKFADTQMYKDVLV